MSGEQTARILIVDDEPLVSWSLSRALQKLGFNVSLCSSGEEALKTVSTSPFDLVITDINLPQFDGIMLANAVKSLFPTTPVILMSAVSEEGNQPSVGSAFDGFIEKPFDLHEVTKQIASLVARNIHPV